MAGDLYDWERCDHRGIGQIGCPICDPDKGRVMTRLRLLDNKDLRARVIAAAPDLLAALKKWESCVATEDAADQAAAWREFEGLARAAIARAEGRDAL